MLPEQPIFPKSAPLNISPYQTRWPGEFETIYQDLHQTLGDLARQIDHIGSTSVPGLPAKDIIDIQITVGDLVDQRIYQALETAGYQVLPADKYRDSLVGHDNPEDPQLQKRFVKEKAGERRANIHIREAGRLNQEYPLLFRDFLRGHPEARDAYCLIKERLAKLYPESIDGYLYIKDPVMDMIYQLAKSQGLSQS